MKAVAGHLGPDGRAVLAGPLQFTPIVLQRASCLHGRLRLLRAGLGNLERCERHGVGHGLLHGLRRRETPQPRRGVSAAPVSVTHWGQDAALRIHAPDQEISAVRVGTGQDPTRGPSAYPSLAHIGQPQGAASPAPRTAPVPGTPPPARSALKIDGFDPQPAPEALDHGRTLNGVRRANDEPQTILKVEKSQRSPALKPGNRAQAVAYPVQSGRALPRPAQPRYDRHEDRRLAEEEQLGVVPGRPKQLLDLPALWLSDNGQRAPGLVPAAVAQVPVGEGANHTDE